MGGNGRKSEPPRQDDNNKLVKPKAPPVEDDDYEDGDFATPKHDRYGTDDEPL